MHKLTGGWPCYGGAMDVLGRLISVFGAAPATFGQVICQTQQSQTNKQTNPKPCTSQIPLIEGADGELVTSDREIADIFQDQFSSSFSDPLNPDVRLVPTPELFLKAIKELKPDSSSESDGVPAILLKACGPELLSLSYEHETCCQTKHKEPRQTPTPTSKPSINQQRPTPPPHLHLPPKLQTPPTYKPPPTSKPPPTYTPPPTSKVQTSTSPPNLQTYTPPNAKKSGTAERPRPSDFLTQITNLLN
eukprot:sb/3468839/